MYEDVLKIQIALRALIKMEFAYSEILTPIDFLNFYRIALELKKAQEDELEKIKHDQYTK